MVLSGLGAQSLSEWRLGGTCPEAVLLKWQTMLKCGANHAALNGRRTHTLVVNSCLMWQVYSFVLVFHQIYVEKGTSPGDGNIFKVRRRTPK